MNYQRVKIDKLKQIRYSKKINLTKKKLKFCKKIQL